MELKPELRDVFFGNTFCTLFIDISRGQARVDFPGGLCFCGADEAGEFICLAMILGYDVVLNGVKYIQQNKEDKKCK